jgi:prepilin-type N-terminal cleavage/methylation domain-containing protein
MALNRRGMTLVELLVAMVAAALVMGAVYQVLVTNQRVYTVQRESIMGHQTIRAGADVLFAELREVSPMEGDLLDLGEDQVEFRAMRGFGILCNVNTSESRISVVVRSEEFLEGQTALLFYEHDPDDPFDDEWVEVPIQGAQDASSSCPQDGRIQRLNLPDLAGGAFSGLRLGAPVRATESFVYGAFQVDGAWYLARRRSGSTATVPLVGPLAGREGLHFEYLAADGTETTVPAEVRRIRVTLRTASGATDQFGTVVADSLTADVFLRN